MTTPSREALQKMTPVPYAAIIAGGASQRMGFPKALLTYQGETLITRTARILSPLFERVIVVTADVSIAQATQLEATPDIFPSKGPLGGVHAALTFFQAPTFCVACDLPFLRGDAVEFLCQQFGDCDVLAPRVQNRMEPLHAIYAPTCLPLLTQVLAQERVGKIERTLATLRLKFVEEAALLPLDARLQFLTNVNTPEQWQSAHSGA